MAKNFFIPRLDLRESKAQAESLLPSYVQPGLIQDTTHAFSCPNCCHPALRSAPPYLACISWEEHTPGWQSHQNQSPLPPAPDSQLQDGKPWPYNQIQLS